MPSTTIRGGATEPPTTDALLSYPQVSVRLLCALADVLQRRGIRTEKVLGETLELIRTAPDEGRVLLVDYQSVFARAITVSEDSALGLYCGFEAAAPSLGLISHLISHAARLRHGIELAIRFHPLLLDGAGIELNEHEGTATIRCELPRTDSIIDRSLAEFIVAGLYRALRAFGCARSDVEAICFTHEPPAYSNAYVTAFQGAARFSQRFTGISFSAQLLDRPHLQAIPELELLLRVEAERSLQRLKQTMSFGDRVFALMRRLHPEHSIEMAVVAREMRLSSRTLRRRLAADGRSFRSLGQAVLRDHACALLRDPSRTPESVAQALGFSDVTTFYRAFKRWTNVTPRAYRTFGSRPASDRASTRTLL